MKIKIIIFLILGMGVVGICLAQTNLNNTTLPIGSNSYSSKETNNTNSTISTSETTKMNGNTSTASGVPISSTSIGSQGRNTPNNGV